MFNHTGWMTEDYQTDRPKAVLYLCVVEDFGGVFVLSLYEFPVGTGAFVIGLSQICPLFSSFTI